jgi:2-dehydropantoate 2-reductase
MRILVIGAGAIGGWLAGVLARGGADVTVLARGATLAALRSDGLTLLHGDRRETLRLPASDRAADLGKPDAVVLAVKTNGFADAVASAPQCSRRPAGGHRHERPALVVPIRSRRSSAEPAPEAADPGGRAAALLALPARWRP